MNAPCFHNRLFLWVALIAAWGFVSWAGAEQPAVTPPQPVSNSPRAKGAKPQVIYHLPPASNYAAALHSQAKTRRDALPVDNGGPRSLPPPRNAANEAAAKAPEPAPSRPRPNSSPAVHGKAVKRHPNSSGSTLQYHPAGKGPGHGSGHGNKGHRK